MLAFSSQCKFHLRSIRRICIWHVYNQDVFKTFLEIRHPGDVSRRVLHILKNRIARNVKVFVPYDKFLMRHGGLFLFRHRREILERYMHAQTFRRQQHGCRKTWLFATFVKRVPSLLAEWTVSWNGCFVQYWSHGLENAWEFSGLFYKVYFIMNLLFPSHLLKWRLCLHLICIL